MVTLSAIELLVGEQMANVRNICLHSDMVKREEGFINLVKLVVVLPIPSSSSSSSSSSIVVASFCTNSNKTSVAANMMLPRSVSHIVVFVLFVLLALF